MNFLVKFWKRIKNFFKKNEGQKNWISDKNIFVKSKISQKNIGKIENNNYYLDLGKQKEKEVEKLIKKRVIPIEKELSKLKKENNNKKTENSLSSKKEKNFRESIINVWDCLNEVDFKNIESKSLDGIKRVLIMAIHLFDDKCWKEKHKVINYCFAHIEKDCEECHENEKLNLKKSEFHPFSADNADETSFWIIEGRSDIKEELNNKGVFLGIRLRVWVDKKSKRKEYFWLVDKKEFSEKKLFRNKKIVSAIIGERNKMSIVKVKKIDSDANEYIRKLQGINITEAAFLNDKEFATENKGHEIWLLEKDKIKVLLKKRWDKLIKTLIYKKI